MKKPQTQKTKKKKVIIGSIIAAVGISASIFYFINDVDTNSPKEEIAIDDEKGNDEEKEEKTKKQKEDDIDLSDLITEEDKKKFKGTEADFSFLEDEDDYEKIPESEQPTTEVDAYLTTEELALRERKFPFDEKRDDEDGYKLSNKEFDNLYASREKPSKQFLITNTGTIIDMYETGDEKGVRLNLRIYTGNDIERAELHLNDPDRFYQEGRLYDVIADDYMEVDFEIGEKVTFKGYYEPYMFDDAVYKILGVKNATLEKEE